MTISQFLVLKKLKGLSIKPKYLASTKILLLNCPWSSPTLSMNHYMRDEQSKWSLLCNNFGLSLLNLCNYVKLSNHCLRRPKNNRSNFSNTLRFSLMAGRCTKAIVKGQVIFMSFSKYTNWMSICPTLQWINNSTGWIYQMNSGLCKFAEML